MNYTPPKITDWLPITRKEMKQRNWEEMDVVIITGDAYVDHPSFGAAVIGRIIESEGFRVGIIPQPNWQDDGRDFQKFGKPRLFFGITDGNMDAMVNHYTANKRLRSNDPYTPGGESGFRPDYASVVYAQKVKEIYPEVPIVLGGVGASLRRFTHYDYWSGKLQASILEQTKADMLIYGMAEKPLVQLLTLLQQGADFHSLLTIPQTAIMIGAQQALPSHQTWEDKELVSHANCLKDKKLYAANFKTIETESNKMEAARVSQVVGKERVLVNPPYPPMTEQEMDKAFDLPYTRLPHPKYKKRGNIPAYEMIKFSVNMHRGCFGGCSFCTISAHQGKFVANRSPQSIVREVEKISQMPDFKGYLSDLGGPSANMYGMKGYDLDICAKCVRPSCIYPNVCSNLNSSHKALLSIYRKVNAMPAIKKAFVSSGIRYDLLVPSRNKHADPNELNEYLEQVVQHHVSGRLKVAPEHSSDHTLKIMRKPSFDNFKYFAKQFHHYSKKHGLKLQLIPYFISSHPGSTMMDMAHLAAETKDMGFRLEQVQDFTPTPMTVATVIYHSGYHPYTLKKVFTATSKEEKQKQNRFFFWYKNENKGWIRRQLNGNPQLLQRLLSR